MGVSTHDQELPANTINTITDEYDPETEYSVQECVKVMNEMKQMQIDFENKKQYDDRYDPSSENYNSWLVDYDLDAWNRKIEEGKYFCRRFLDED